MAIGIDSDVDLLAAVPVAEVQTGEDIFRFLQRQGGFQLAAYNRLLGAANEFKEGDEIIGVAAADAASRQRARQLLSATRISDIVAHPPFRDPLQQFADQSVDATVAERVSDWTLAQLKRFLLEQGEAEIQQLLPGLHSDVIGCVVKLMSNDELIRVGANIFHSLPGSQIGARGYLGARVQPNSPTDHPDDIRWQVFDAFSYTVGDVLLGTNPVSSTPESVAAVQATLKDVLVTFGIDHLMPHCVLSHIDVQHQVESQQPGSTELWFQSIGGTEGANGTFDLSLEKMQDYARQRNGRFGLYFETGQGADFTNGHGHGFDMVLHESRKYGFARALSQMVQKSRHAAGRPAEEAAWVHLNDVAGFIGPEVFRTRQQLVRCCLEDIVMGKLHGLCLGLDVCSTLHMDVSLDDLDWCLEQIMPANPAYLMALPTKIDPMLGYLTTAFQDHVRLRDKFGYKINDAMWKFYQQLGVVDQNGRPTKHFGDPTWVYLQYQRRKQDTRSDEEIQAEGRRAIEQVRSRGLFMATGHGQQHYDHTPELKREVQAIYEDGKDSIWQELTPEFINTVPQRVDILTRSTDRNDYILHPESGEHLSAESLLSLGSLREQYAGNFDVQIVVSDGLNAHSIMDEGQLLPFLQRLREQLAEKQYRVSPQNVLVQSGRVRTGYRIGEALFGAAGADAQRRRGIIHVIGERPGTGHHTFSAYLTQALPEVWAEADRVDHNITKVVSGIANTALRPKKAADQTAKLFSQL